MPLALDAEYCEVDGIVLPSGVVPNAWLLIPDLSPLWDLADEKGDDVGLLGVDGSRGFPRYRAATSASVPFFLFGEFDRDGDGVAGLDDQRTQLWDHVTYLAANVLGRSGDSDGARDIEVHVPGGDTIEGRGSIARRLTLTALSPSSLTGTFLFRLLDGELAVAGS